MIITKKIELGEVEAANRYHELELKQTPGHAVLVYLGLDDVNLK